jgi:hypothetical protein
MRICKFRVCTVLANLRTELPWKYCLDSEDGKENVTNYIEKQLSKNRKPNFLIAHYYQIDLQGISWTDGKLWWIFVLLQSMRQLGPEWMLVS